MGQTRNLRDGQMTLQDSGAAASVVLTLEMGNLTWTETTNNIQVLDRGTLDHVRAGNQASVTLSFSVKIDRVSEATSPVTVYDAFHGTDSAAAWNSTAGSHEPYAIDIVFRAIDPAGGSDHEDVTFTKVFKETFVYSEGDEFNTLEFSGFAFQVAPGYA